MAINPWVDFGGTVFVGLAAGLGSGVFGARMNERAATRREERQRRNEMIPAVREWAALLKWQGEVNLQMRTGSGPPQDRWSEAERRFNDFRHDLPPNIQQKLDDPPRGNPAEGFAEEDFWTLEVADDLNAWIKAQVAAKDKEARWSKGLLSWLPRPRPIGLRPGNGAESDP